MKNLKVLERKKLLKEIDYIKSDLEYKSELVAEADAEFMSAVKSILDSSPTLKQAFDNKINKHIEELVAKKSIEEIQKETIEVDESISYTDDDTSPAMKKAYREIVKLTHPDMCKNDELNEIYLQATKMYSEKDIAGFASICVRLGVDFEIDDDDKVLMMKSLENMRLRISFIESTFSWNWMISQDEDAKKEMLAEYIKRAIS
jgi:hypothetical protein